MGRVSRPSTRRLVDCIGSFGCTTILAPWRHDPHCDHTAAACLAADVARIAGIRHVAYPVWGGRSPLTRRSPSARRRAGAWHVAPYLAAKRRAIAAHASQHGGLDRG